VNFVVSNASRKSHWRQNTGNRLASIVFPAPGGPIKIIL
jgi:hypothetical protein